jgi:hypothetical protein
MHVIVIRSIRCSSIEGAIAWLEGKAAAGGNFHANGLACHLFAGLDVGILFNLSAIDGAFMGREYMMPQS